MGSSTLLSRRLVKSGVKGTGGARLRLSPELARKRAPVRSARQLGGAAAVRANLRLRCRAVGSVWLAQSSWRLSRVQRIEGRHAVKAGITVGRPGPAKAARLGPTIGFADPSIHLEARQRWPPGRCSFLLRPPTFLTKAHSTGAASSARRH
jgi:hypothetical protein